MVAGVREHGTQDANLILKAAGAVTASGAVATIRDLGAATGTYGTPAAYGRVIIDISAMAIDGNDEAYDLILQGSPDADFGTDTNIVELAAIHVGAAETKRSDANGDDAVGRYILPFTNVRNGTNYRYVRMYHVHTGATTSINYSAYIASDLS